MIIEYSRPARCKDCDYCAEYRKNNKDGILSKRKSYRCNLDNKEISYNQLICDKFKFEME